MTEAAKSKEQTRGFVERWKGRGYEKGDSQVFWIELLHDVLGVERPTDIISFESQVHLSHTSFIDAYISSTKVLIEQKSIDKDLRKPIPQSDGTMLTPFQQAKRYSSELPLSKHPRWVVACNFRSFLIYDMEQPQGEPFEVLLENLERDAHLLSFMVSDEREKLRHEMEVSIEAGALVGKLYDALLTQYGGEVNDADLHALNVLCVRLVFCLYAEDAGVFGKCQFAHYLMDFAPAQIRVALRDLFLVLDTPVERRDRFLEPKLKAFPYVNGSLFREQEGETIPPFTRETTDLLIQEASLGFDWSQISPTIFGAVFESTLNPETRRSGGMHYTSIENIHKVIDPLFLNGLSDEMSQISLLANGKSKRDRLEKFQQKLASLKFLDPACGSGNFLTETYVSLRRLENKVIEQLTHGQMLLGLEEVNPIKVSIHQFYGIEINDFAVTVAKTALWIAEAQMMAETEKIIRFNDDYLPLKTYNNIAEGNALRIDWNEVCPAEELNYIIGNPPFVGARMKSKAQADDLLEIFSSNWKGVGNIDYVGGWYKKAADMMNLNANIFAAFVSTNSISQGEQVSFLWKKLMAENVHIDFAYTTFVWESESYSKASVHCVIIGFSKEKIISSRRLFTANGDIIKCNNINAYLLDAGNVFVEPRTTPICDVPLVSIGNKPIDGGFLIFTEEEKDDFIKKEPKSEKYFKLFYGAYEFINQKKRYILWLGECSPAEIKSMPLCYERISAVREYRLSSKSPGTQKLALKPTHFHVENMPKGSYVVIPQVSSQARNYIPMGFMDDSSLCSDKLRLSSGASLYHFGVLESSTHMSWMRAICCRLKSDYSYTINDVYNNFPWPTPTDTQKEKIEKTAQAILDARALYPDSSLADLYDDLTMPVELRRAHQANDRAVMEAYAFALTMTESDIVARLLEMYEQLTIDN